MKTFLALLLSLFTLTAFGQGTAIRANNGFGTNLTLYGSNVIAGSLGSSVIVQNGQIVATPLLDAPGFTGNGSGLTNLASATNFPSTVTYVFNGKTTFNAVSYNTNLWAGPTNTIILSTNYQDFIASGDCNITNVGGQLARQNTWATLIISNSTGANITVRSTAPGLRLQGSATTAALTVGAGKEAFLSFHSRDFKSTNLVNTAQQ